MIELNNPYKTLLRKTMILDNITIVLPQVFYDTYYVTHYNAT